MVTLNGSQLAELAKLGETLHKLEATAAQKAVKRARRVERWAAFNRSIRDGLRYSHGCVRRLRVTSGDGGAVPEWRLRRIIP